METKIVRVSCVVVTFDRFAEEFKGKFLKALRKEAEGLSCAEGSIGPEAIADHYAFAFYDEMDREDFFRRACSVNGGTEKGGFRPVRTEGSLLRSRSGDVLDALDPLRNMKGAR